MYLLFFLYACGGTSCKSVWVFSPLPTNQLPMWNGFRCCMLGFLTMHHAMWSNPTPFRHTRSIPTSLHGYSIFSTFNPLCQAPLNLFVLFLFLRNARRDVSFLFFFWELKKNECCFFSCWFIVLILYSDFFCNVCFLRKEIKCILILKKKSWPYPICSAWWLYQPSLPPVLSFTLLSPLSRSHQLNGYCWYPCPFVS